MKKIFVGLLVSVMLLMLALPCGYAAQSSTFLSFAPAMGQSMQEVKSQNAGIPDGEYSNALSYFNSNCYDLALDADMFHATAPLDRLSYTWYYFDEKGKLYLVQYHYVYVQTEGYTLMDNYADIDQALIQAMGIQPSEPMQTIWMDDPASKREPELSDIYESKVVVETTWYNADHSEMVLHKLFFNEELGELTHTVYYADLNAGQSQEAVPDSDPDLLFTTSFGVSRDTVKNSSTWSDTTPDVDDASQLAYYDSINLVERTGDISYQFSENDQLERTSMLVYYTSAQLDQALSDYSAIWEMNTYLHGEGARVHVVLDNDFNTVSSGVLDIDAFKEKGSFLLSQWTTSPTIATYVALQTSDTYVLLEFCYYPVPTQP